MYVDSYYLSYAQSYTQILGVSMLVRCDVCTGRKTVIGLGNIPKSCPGCAGKGVKLCNDVANAARVIKAGLIVSDDTLDLVGDKNINEQPVALSKKELQSERMKKAWAERKAKEAK